jgi:hypothetical protein
MKHVLYMQRTKLYISDEGFFGNSGVPGLSLKVRFGAISENFS